VIVKNWDVCTLNIQHQYPEAHLASSNGCLQKLGAIHSVLDINLAISSRLGI
jgi:hypothetical protein